METTRNRDKTTLRIAGVGIGIFICSLVVCAALVGGLAWVGSRTAEQSPVESEAPAEKLGGKSVEFSVSVTSIITETVELDSIHISLDYLSGLVIESTDPPYAESSQFNSWGGKPFRPLLNMYPSRPARR